MISHWCSSSIAISYTDRSLRYRDLYNQAYIISTTLKEYIQPQDIVLQMMPKGTETIVGILSIALTNGVYCPYHFKDPKDRLQQLIDITNSKVILSHSSIESNLRWILDKHPNITILYVDSILQSNAVNLEVASEGLLPIEMYIAPTDLAYLISTSGSTGIPKLVSIEWRSILNLKQGMESCIGWNSASRVLQLSRCSFDAQISEIYVTLLLGATIVMPFEDWNYSLGSLVSTINMQQVTSIFMVPSLVPSLQKASPGLMESVTSIIIGGEAVYESIIKSLKILFPNARVFVAYGPTETCVYSSFLDTEAYEGTDRWYPIGYPLPNYEYRLIDSEDEWIYNTNIEGELCIGGIGVMRGYYQNETQTQCSVLTKDGRRWYKTGDLARRDDTGCWHFVGRKDFQVKFNGQRLELGEIESHLQGLEGVERSVVIKRIVNKQEQLVGYIQTSQTELTSRQCRSFLSDKVPTYMIPLQWVFLSTFPQTSSGKIDRKQLPEPTLSFV